MRNHYIPSRRHVQGQTAPIRVRFSASGLTDGGGLLLLRRLWDSLNLGPRIDTLKVGGRYGSSLIVEVWIALLWYGGDRLDDIKLVARREVRKLLGWVRIPDPTTVGRWLRRAGDGMAAHLDEVLWWVVQQRWRITGIPERVILCLDSTVLVRYGLKQAGAEKGYNPKKPGRPSHHPLVAFLVGTGDCLGVRWRPGSAHTAAGAIPWIELLVQRLRAAGVEHITVRLDKGFWSQAMVQALEALGVDYVLKVPAHAWVGALMGPWRQSRKDPRLWTATGELWGARLLSVQKRELLTDPDGLDLETWQVGKPAHILTNIEGIHALTAWRTYNDGALVEQRIEELGQLGVGRTAIDDLGGNALLWALGALAYQLLHFIRTTALPGTWRTAQPNRLRAFLIRLPARITTHARKLYAQLARGDPLRPLFLRALRILGTVGSPLPA